MSSTSQAATKSQDCLDRVEKPAEELNFEFDDLEHLGGKKHQFSESPW